MVVVLEVVAVLRLVMLMVAQFFMNRGRVVARQRLMQLYLHGLGAAVVALELVVAPLRQELALTVVMV